MRHRDFRYFLTGSFISNTGSWMQSVAQAWLVLQLTNSPFYLGLDGFANTIPIAVFAFWGGVIADRFNRKRLLVGTQWVMGGLALVLGILTQLHRVNVWHVIAFSFCTGLTQSLAWPVYQSILANIVRREHLSNAIALNSTQFNLARLIGPLFGAVALRYFGTAGCFYANAVSFLAVIIALRFVTVPARSQAEETSEIGLMQSFKDGFSYIVQSGGLYWMLLLMAVSSLFGVPLVTLLPLFARDILKVGASGLGILIGAFGAGAVLGGMGVAYRGDFPRKGRFVLVSIFLYVGAMLGFAVSRNIVFSSLCLSVAGLSMVGYASVINTLIQTSVPDRLRGRAVSLFVVSFAGFMPFGNLLAGYLAHLWSGPAALIALGLTLGSFALYVSLSHPDVHRLS